MVGLDILLKGWRDVVSHMRPLLWAFHFWMATSSHTQLFTLFMTFQVFPPAWEVQNKQRLSVWMKRSPESASSHSLSENGVMYYGNHETMLRASKLYFQVIYYNLTLASQVHPPGMPMALFGRKTLQFLFFSLSACHLFLLFWKEACHTTMKRFSTLALLPASHFSLF